jgi:hypothetical protein
MNRVDANPETLIGPQGHDSFVLPPHLAAAKQELFSTYDTHMEQGIYMPPIDSELKVMWGRGIYRAGSYVVRKALAPHVSLESYVDGMVGGLNRDDGIEQLVMAHRNDMTGNVDTVYSHYVSGIPRNLVRSRDIQHYGHAEFERTLTTLQAMGGDLAIEGDGANLIFQKGRICIVDYTRGPQSLAEKVECVASGICYGGVRRLIGTPEESGEMTGRLPVLETLLEACDQREQHDIAWRGSADAVSPYVKLLRPIQGRTPHPQDEPVKPFEW